MKMTLRNIIENKKREMTVPKEKRNSFQRSLLRANNNSISFIAEIKMKSPSSGKLGTLNDVKEKVRSYENGGADCLSVVVDKKYFGGSYELLRRVRSYSHLPILSKDFVIDPIQVYEAKFSGADAVLLIAKIVVLDRLRQLIQLVKKLGMKPVIEVHTLEELEQVLSLGSKMIAVNARNLDDFSVDIVQACRVIRKIPNNKIPLAFSGVRSRSDVVQYKNAGAKGVLIGTTLMQSKDPVKIIKELKGL